MSDRTKGDDPDRKPAARAKARGGSKGGAGARGGGRARNSNWGRVLRTAYDDTLREQVPDEFIDLLGKLD